MTAITTDYAPVQDLFDHIAAHYPTALTGITEARAIAPERFDEIVSLHLEWAVAARGDNAVPECGKAFVEFCMSVNMAQARYEQSGSYAAASFDECYSDIYAREQMDDYLWGSFLTNLLWAHHFQLILMFRDRFVDRLPDDASIMELAFGHGAWGVWALSCRPDAELTGYDISPSSIAIAEAIATAAGVNDRVHYLQGDALRIPSNLQGRADACICNFLVEHLEHPGELFDAVQRLLRPDGVAFITGALTAAQVDHIYEFKRESELMVMAEDHGLRVLETLSTAPQRTLKDARSVPRSMALIVQNRIPGTW